MDVLTLISKKIGCYKVSLDCADRVVPLYSKFGFQKQEMQHYMTLNLI